MKIVLFFNEVTRHLLKVLQHMKARRQEGKKAKKNKKQSLDKYEASQLIMSKNISCYPVFVKASIISSVHASQPVCKSFLRALKRFSKRLCP